MFTEENRTLLEAASYIDFKFTKTGSINSARHTKYELGLYFIKKSVERHGNTYGYNKVNYVNNSTKVTIRCSIHENFEMSPNNHLKGKGCPKCSGNYSPNTEEFIEKLGMFMETSMITQK